MPKGRVRKLAEALAVSANELEAIAHTDPQIRDAYNALCGVLNTLNEKLSDEDDGPLPVNWGQIVVR